MDISTLLNLNTDSEIKKEIKNIYNEICDDHDKFKTFLKVIANNPDFKFGSQVMIYLQAPDAKNVSSEQILGMEYNREPGNTTKPLILAQSSNPNDQKSKLIFNTYYDAEQCQEKSPSRKYDELNASADNEYELEALSAAILDTPYSDSRQFFLDLAKFFCESNNKDYKELHNFYLKKKDEAVKLIAQILASRIDSKNSYDFISDLNINSVKSNLINLQNGLSYSIVYTENRLYTTKRILNYENNQSIRNSNERSSDNQRNSEHITIQRDDRGGYSILHEDGAQYRDGRSLEATSQESELSDNGDELSIHSVSSRLGDNLQGRVEQNSQSGRAEFMGQSAVQSHDATSRVETSVSDQNGFREETSDLYDRKRENDLRRERPSQSETSELKERSESFISGTDNTAANFRSAEQSTADGRSGLSDRVEDSRYRRENSSDHSADVSDREQGGLLFSGDGISREHDNSSSRQSDGNSEQSGSKPVFSADAGSSVTSSSLSSSETDQTGIKAENITERSATSTNSVADRIFAEEPDNREDQAVKTVHADSLSSSGRDMLAGRATDNSQSGDVHPAETDGRGDSSVNSTDDTVSVVFDDPSASVFDGDTLVKSEGSNYELQIDSNYNNYTRYVSHDRAENNLAALTTLYKITSENRNFATPDEQHILSLYSGWGGVYIQHLEVFKDRLFNEAHITQKDYNGILSSLNTAYFTHTVLIDKMYEKLNAFGFKGGKILEPSCGTGKFLGRLPKEMQQSSELTAVEIDTLSAKIASLLYPEAHVKNTGFEKTVAENYYDVAIGNVPFGQIIMQDPHDKSLSGNSIHNYFFLKSLKEVHPNGVVAFLTSSFTLDATGSKVREEIAKKAKFLGAVRLPDTAFSSTGTDVVTDMIFLQKREQELDHIDLSQPEFSWVCTNDQYLRNYAVDEDNEKAYQNVRVNNYFIEHPEQVIGTLYAKSTAYGFKACNSIIENYDSFSRDGIDKHTEFDAEFISAVDAALNNITTSQSLEYHPVNQSNVITERKDVNTDVLGAEFVNARPFSYYLDRNNNIYYKTDKNTEPVLQTDFTGKSQKIATKLIQLRDTYRELRDLELSDSTEDEITNVRNQLNTLYDDFYKNYAKEADNSKAYLPEIQGQHKPVMEYFVSVNRTTKKLLGSDNSFNSLLALEKVNNDGVLIGKADVFSKRVLNYRERKDHADNPQDALIMSINEKGRVDIPFMATLLKENDYKELTSQLFNQKLIYRDPSQIDFDENGKVVPFSGYVTADEYLSGNIYQKIDDARNANEKFNTELFNSQIADLEKVIPPKLTSSDISIEIGARFVDPEIYLQFFNDLIKAEINHKFVYNKHLHQFAFDGDSKYPGVYNSEISSVYGTKTLNALQIFEKMLNFESVEVKKSIDSVDKNGNLTTISVIDPEQTQANQAKVKLIQSKFKEWIFSNDERRDYLVDKYNRLYNAIKPREYNGDLFSFDGINPNIHLRPHQKNAIARTLLGGNTLLAHEVGAGKTFEMCASAMEKIRLGLAHKCVIVTPNPVLTQFSKEFYTLYPNANILTATKNDFKKENRAKFLARAAYGDANIILMSKEQFEKIPMSFEYQEAFINHLIEENDEAFRTAKNIGLNVISKKCEQRKTTLLNKLQKLNESNNSKDYSLTFEELGCDALYVDEAHNYKNAEVFTLIKNVPLASPSNRARDMQMKCQYLNDKFDNKAVVFATGTAISNSVVDLYTMQTYINKHNLEAADVDSLDSFIAQFGTIESKAELDATGQNFVMKKRLRSFRNIPDVMKIFGECADIKTQNDIKDLLSLPKAHFHYEECPASDFQKDYIQDIAIRARAVKEHKVKPNEDNMLKISSDGRKLGLDPRIIDADAPDDPYSKVNKCVQNVFDIYEKETPNKGTQLVFCDMSTPSKTRDPGTFCLYDDIKQKLIDKGVKEDEIAFIHDFETEDARDELFDNVKKGKVRILLGSTSKLGTGVNVQTRLKAVHHLDINWKPSDLEQRNGRIIRQGNMNSEVDVYNYISKGTFDAFMYQTVMTKANFISKIMKNQDHVERNISLDDEEPTFSYSECMAAAVGDERIKQKIELESKLEELKLEKKIFEKNLMQAKSDLNVNLPAQISKLKSQAEGYKKDLTALDKNKQVRLDPKSFVITLNNKIYTDKASAGKAILSAVATLDVSAGTIELGSYCDFKILVSKKKGQSTKDNPTGYINYMQLIGPSLSSSDLIIGPDAVGNITRMNNTLNMANKKLDDVVKESQSLQSKLDVARDIVENHNVWDGQAEYEEVEAKHQQLLKELNIEASKIIDAKAEVIEESPADEQDNLQSQDHDYENVEAQELPQSVIEKRKNMLNDPHVIVVSAPSAYEVKEDDHSDTMTESEPEIEEYEDNSKAEVKDLNIYQQAQNLIHQKITEDCLEIESKSLLKYESFFDQYYHFKFDNAKCLLIPNAESVLIPLSEVEKMMQNQNERFTEMLSDKDLTFAYRTPTNLILNSTNAYSSPTGVKEELVDAIENIKKFNIKRSNGYEFTSSWVYTQDSDKQFDIINKNKHMDQAVFSSSDIIQNRKKMLQVPYRNKNGKTIGIDGIDAQVFCNLHEKESLLVNASKHEDLWGSFKVKSIWNEAAGMQQITKRCLMSADLDKLSHRQIYQSLDDVDSCKPLTHDDLVRLQDEEKKKDLVNIQKAINSMSKGM